MFNWVVKVVPQPPDAAGTEEAVKTSDAPLKITEAPVKPVPPKNTEEVSEDGHAQTGVLGWLSNGFVSALPQPSSSPRLSRANSEARSGEDADRSGVMNWVTQGLTKVLPQPDEKYRETQKDNKDEERTEVYDVETMPDFDPLPHIPVVEMVSDEEMEMESTTTHFTSNVVTWIKQRVPQPVPPGAVPVDPPTKSSRSSLDKILSPPPESLSGISLDTDSKASGVVNWFVSGLGLKLPQPVTPSKDEANSPSEVIQKASAKLKPDMVLEDVESDNEGQQKREDPPQAEAPSAFLVPPSPAAQQQQEVKEVAQAVSVASQKCSDAEPEPQPSESAAKISLEDAETQTGRWTPFIENIKKEAEGVALATMEERLLQERLEMARMAEEVARQTAEMAVRQMASEGQSIKLSLGSQEPLEEPEAELQVPLEEESEVELSTVPEKKDSLAQEEQKVETEQTAINPEPQEETSISPPPRSEPVNNSESNPEQAIQPESEPESAPESAPEPETNTQEITPEAEPVTEQPQKKEENGQAANPDKAPEKEEEASDCGENSNISLRPAVNVEDVDSDHEKAGGATGGRGGGGNEGQAPQILTPQDPKLTTLTVPVTPSGGRQSKGDKERRLHSESEDDDEEGSIPVRAWPSQSSLHSADDVLKERPASSASQTSTVVNERLQELVRMFKERTEKAKEKLIDPDSSDEDSIITC